MLILLIFFSIFSSFSSELQRLINIYTYTNIFLESINRIKAKRKELKDMIITLKREYEGLEEKYSLLKEALESLDNEIKTKEGETESLLIAYKYDETDIRKNKKVSRLKDITLDYINLLDKEIHHKDHHCMHNTHHGGHH